MSVIVKGIEIPKCCFDCELIGIVTSCPHYDLPSEAYCQIDYTRKRRDKDCPLIELPPHVRLIDADALITTFCEWGTRLERGRKLVITMCEAKQAIVDIIEDATTIIPAEEGE